MRSLFLVLLIVFVAVLWASVFLRSLVGEAPDLGEVKTRPGEPNPPAVFCLRQGGRLAVRTTDAVAKELVCVFNDGQECLLPDVYSGICPAKQ